MRPLTTNAALHPPWLKNILDDDSSAPKLYAWNPSNLSGFRDYQPPGGNDASAQRIYIHGVGNVGRLYAIYMSLATNPPPVTLVVHREEKLAQWMASAGLEVERKGVMFRNKKFDIEWWTDTPPDRGTVREVADGRTLGNLIIATKSDVALPEFDRIRRYLGPESTVGFAQNGMNKLWPPHGAAYLSHRYPEGNAPNILHCITTHGVTSQGTFQSRHASPADACVGPIALSRSAPSSADYMIQSITSAPHLNSYHVPKADLWVLQLEKLIINAHINPLTAILRCKNAVLFDEDAGAITDVINKLLREATQVLQALVNHESSTSILATAADPGSSLVRAAAITEGDDFLASLRASLTERFSYAQQKFKLLAVGEKVKENTSSMLQDALAGRKTEVKDMNGWLVEMAAIVDPSLDVSGHRRIVKLVEEETILTKKQLGEHILG